MLWEHQIAGSNPAIPSMDKQTRRDDLVGRAMSLELAAFMGFDDEELENMAAEPIEKGSGDVWRMIRDRVKDGRIAVGVLKPRTVGALDWIPEL